MKLLLVVSSLTWRLNLSQLFIVWSFKNQGLFYYYLRIIQNIFPSHLRQLNVFYPLNTCVHVTGQVMAKSKPKSFDLTVGGEDSFGIRIMLG